MFPGYRYMNPYCQTFPQREPNSYACQYYPGWEAKPWTKVDPSKQPPGLMPSPFNNNIYHPHTGDHGGGCHHSCPSSYYDFRPQFSSVQPPPQPYLYGPYPPYPGPYNAYFIPPPHYSVDQARYDYDKTRTHCCGCPNHTCHRNADNLPKIEEQMPEKGQDGDTSGLIQLPNYSSPFVWVPASSVEGKEGDKVSEMQPGPWDGWVPLDINRLKGSRQEEEGKNDRQVDDEWPKARSSFPIIWLPGYNKPEEELKDLKVIPPKSVEDWPSKFKIVPMKLLENEDNGGRSLRAVQEEPENQVEKEKPVEKETKIKTIPVRKTDEKSQKKTNMLEKQEGNVDQKKATIREKQKEESEVDKASEKKQSSPGRPSKLPPVCLRVDPLPRKMRANGTSRSPSPPGHKDMRDHKDREEQSPRTGMKEKLFEKVIPVVNVKDVTSSQQVEKELKHQGSTPVVKVSSKESQVQETAKEMIEESKMVENESGEKKSAEAECEQKMEAAKGLEEALKNIEVKEMKEKNETKRDLSQTDAAVIIQSAYRGNGVRRWQPLEKLRKIAKIREQVGNVRRQIECIEASGKELDTKQRMVIGETIMHLLLQLDTIQGLHPCVREERKCVARELIYLQDKLDSLNSQRLAKIEEETKTMDGAAAVISSSVDTAEESSKQESLEDKIETASDETTKGAAQADANHVDSSCTGEAISVTSQPILSESACEQESMLPVEENIMRDEPSFESDDETAKEAKPSIAAPDSEKGANLSKLTSEQDIVETVKENSASENLYLESVKTESKLEGISEETEPSGVEKAIDRVSNDDLGKEDGSTDGLTCNDEEHGKVSSGLVSNDISCKEGYEEYSKLASDVVSNDVSNDVPCKKDESVEAPICHDEQYNKPSFEDAVLGLDEKSLVKPLKEVNHQKDEAVLDDVGAEGRANVLVEAEELKMALDAGECVVSKENESKPETETRKETHDRGEDLLVLPPVDESDGMDVSVRVEDVDRTRKEHSCPEDAVKVDDALLEKKDEIISEDLLKSEDTGDASEEYRLKAIGEEIAGPIREMPLPVYNMNEPGQTPVAEPVVHASVMKSGSSSSACPAPEPEGKEVKDSTTENADINAAMDEQGRKLLNENEKLRKMLAELLEAGKEQLAVMSNLKGRVNDLERKLAQKKKKAIKVRRSKPAKPHSCEVSC